MQAVIFAKPPVPGEAKSRLASAIGEIAAASFARAALIDTINRLAAVEPLTLSLSTSRPSSDWPLEAKRLPQRLQPPGDLGSKMTEAVEHALTNHRSVMLWGADAPHFEPQCPFGVIEALEEVDVVLCPSSDGGFYALGTRVPLSGLFNGIRWSTEVVCKETRERCENAGLSVRLLYPNFDVDHVSDLNKLVRVVDEHPGRVPQVERWLSQWRNEQHLGLGWPK